MKEKVETTADIEIRSCLDNHQSFALIAGAGSGKTSSLVEALERVRQREGHLLRQNGQRVACITFTKRAVEVIKSRLGFDHLYMVSTLHSFLWEQMGRFQSDILEALRLNRLPRLIEKEQKNSVGNSRAAVAARAKLARFEQDLVAIETVKAFKYSDTPTGNYSNGQLSHDDIIEIATYLFAEKPTFRRITGLRFPYIFVDEAQDTFAGIIRGLNLVCNTEGLPIVGYFGDPWQQIYDNSVGVFNPPKGSKVIPKTENFRCSKSVIRFLNAFRDDVKQHPAGENKGREGSVIFRLIKAEEPEMPRKRYSEEQISRALISMDTALKDWGWSQRDDVIRLFLVRQMIARRMGFTNLNLLFNGDYTSSRAKSAFEKGEHFLLMPLTKTIYPLIIAFKGDSHREIVSLLRRDSPAFAIEGSNATKTLNTMVTKALSLVKQLSSLWLAGTIRDVLQFCTDHKLIYISEKLREHLERPPRTEEYEESLYSVDKGDWLADVFFSMNTAEIAPYASFITNNTVYSTQHGVKGEEYSKVIVVYDDVEASWSSYNFSKILTPVVAGQPTDGQLARGKKLAYVSFSRALEDLRVLFFTSNPEAARQELLENNMLKPSQIEVFP